MKLIYASADLHTWLRRVCRCHPAHGIRIIEGDYRPAMSGQKGYFSRGKKNGRNYHVSTRELTVGITWLTRHFPISVTTALLEGGETVYVSPDPSEFESADRRVVTDDWLQIHNYAHTNCMIRWENMERARSRSLDPEEDERLYA